MDQHSYKISLLSVINRNDCLCWSRLENFIETGKSQIRQNLMMFCKLFL